MDSRTMDGKDLIFSQVDYLREVCLPTHMHGDTHMYLCGHGLTCFLFLPRGLERS